MGAARRAWASWSRTTAGERCELLHEVARRLREDAESLARTMTEEGGKPLVENRDELEWTAAAFDYYAEIGRDHAGRVIPPIEASQLAMVVKDPLGVVGCIVPWNYPLLLLAWKVAPALAAGNCVVCKPSELTPLSTLMLAPAFEHLPPGVVSLLAGAGDVGAAPRLPPGRRLRRLHRLGRHRQEGRRGLHAADGADEPRDGRQGRLHRLRRRRRPSIEVAARGGAWAAFLNAGQVCTSAERFYVAEEVFDEYVGAFVEHTRSLVLGDPFEVGHRHRADGLRAAARQGRRPARGGRRGRRRDPRRRRQRRAASAATSSPRPSSTGAAAGLRPAARGDLRPGRPDRPGRLPRRGDRARQRDRVRPRRQRLHGATSRTRSAACASCAPAPSGSTTR